MLNAISTAAPASLVARLPASAPIVARPAPAPVPDSTTARLISLLTNVTNATAHRYRATDDHARTLDCLKIVDAPGDYLGVYHTLREREFQLHLGRSTNLLH